MNITNARSELPLLQALCEEHKWHVFEGNREKKADMYWINPLQESENNARIYNTPAIYNRLPGAGVGTNKAKCANIFERMIRHYPNDFNFIPRTYILPKDCAALQQAMAPGKTTYIFKPSGGAEGCGIFLCQ